MKVIKFLFVVVVVLALLLFGGSFLLPKEYQVSRSTVLAAEPAVVLNKIENLKSWPEWTVWTPEADETCEWEFSEDATGVGATMTWEGDVHMQGDLKITQVDATGMAYDMTSMNGQYKSNGKFLLEPTGDGKTKVTWEMDGDLGGGFERYMGLMMEGTIGPMFEGGLEGLKTAVEAK